MAHVTSQPVRARGGLSITSEFRTMEGGGAAGRKGSWEEELGAQGWLARGPGVPMTVSHSQPWFVSPIQERNEALDDFTGPEPENQVCFIYIQTCW